MLAYDDIYSITYFRKNLRPYWRRDGSGVSDLLRRAEADYQSLAREAEGALDEQFARRGGEGRVASLVANFALATRLEAEFWQMGLDAAS